MFVFTAEEGVSLLCVLLIIPIIGRSGASYQRVYPYFVVVCRLLSLTGQYKGRQTNLPYLA